MLGASSMKHINEVGVNNDPKLIRKNLDQLMRAYSKAPYYDKVFPLMEKILTSEKEILHSTMPNLSGLSTNIWESRQN